MLNLITDLDGVAIGHAHDPALASGVTAIIFDEPTIASVDVRGGAPGTRDTDLLSPEKTRQTVDGISLSGGSLFGLDAVSGLVASLAEQGRGMQLGTARIPIVPGAIIFDLLNGGDKNWGRFPPYRDLGYEAAQAARKGAFPLGTHGGGYGCTTADLKGGLGSASGLSPTGHMVGAIVLVNAVGSATIRDSGHFWAASEEVKAEFGGLGYPNPFPPPLKSPRMKGTRPENTTIAVVVTDATLTKAECRHLAVMAQDGLAIAIRPIHTPLDGDTVFTAATCRKPLDNAAIDIALIGATAANVLARACARAVYEATALPFPGALPAWKDRFGLRS